MAAIDVKREINGSRGNDAIKRVSRTLNLPTDLDSYGVAGDVIQLSDLPQGSIIFSAYLDVLTADSAAADVNLGASSGAGTADNLVDGADCTSTGIKSGGTNVTFTQPIIVTGSDWELKLTANTNALSDGVVRVVIAYMEPQQQSIEGGQVAPGSEQ